MSAPLGGFGIARLAVVQAAIGAVIVLVTSTLNRVMVVELALPAVVPGALIGLHYAVQLLRPRWGYRSDTSRRRTPWILGGMAALALGGTAAAVAVALAATHPWAGLALAILAFTAVGLGVGSAGTALLALAATHVAPALRAVAAPVMWITMIAGFAITAGVAGACLDPFSYGRLVTVVAIVSLAAFGITCAALWRLEGSGLTQTIESAGPRSDFGSALRTVWAEPTTRRFTIFVFLSMLAYSAEDLVIEPFAGALRHLAPGATTGLSGTLHAGALTGMLVVAALGGVVRSRWRSLLSGLAAAGCIGSAAGLLLFATTAWMGTEDAGLSRLVALLGFSNGVFTVAAIGLMLTRAGAGVPGREGLRMGLWGAAQAAAFGLGSILAPATLDVAHLLSASPSTAYATVFAGQAVLFALAAWLARTLLAPAGADHALQEHSMAKAA